MSKDASQDELDQYIIQLLKERKPETVNHLIALIQEEYPLTDHQILGHIQRLQEQGKIHFKPAPTLSTQTLAAYARSTRAAWYWITLVLTAITTATVYSIPAEVYPQAYIRNVLGTIFVLCLPGYAFIKALFPRQLLIKNTDKNLDTVERIALSLGMSIALVPIVGLLLNYTPWGIRLTPITVSLTALTIIFATAALVREHQTASQQAKRQTEPSIHIPTS